MHSFRTKNSPRFYALVLLIGLLTSTGQGQSTSVPPAADCNQDFPNFYTSQTSCEMAKTVCLGGSANPCVFDLVAELGRMPDRCGAQATQALLVREEISEMILDATLQVDGFLSEVDSESGHIRAVRNELSDRRDAAVGRSNLGGAVGTSGTAVGSALSLGSAAFNIAGNWVGATFGGLGAVFGFMGYYQQNGPTGCFPDLRTDPSKREAKNQCQKLDKTATANPASETEATGKTDPAGEPDVGCPHWPRAQPCTSDTPPRGCSPRMLYAFAFRECNDEAGFHSSYDGLINRYLDAPAPGKLKTRREALLETWAVDLAQLRAQQDLFTSNADPRKLSIADLESRTNKLADLRWRVALMHRDLGQLTHDLAIALRCP